MTAPEPYDVELFTQEFCGPCRLVEAFLRERGVPFVTRDVDREPAALEALVAQGYMSTPVTRIGNTWVAGFNRKALERELGKHA